jgi:predicted phage terminase large subunit-like protein
VWPVDALEVKRSKATDYTWSSLYQGRPVPRGSTVFGPPTIFTEPFKVYRSGFGVDLSYSTKTAAHWSIAVEGRIVGDVVQIHNVLRRQVRAPQFRNECHLLHLKAPTAAWLWYASTTEIGVADLFRESSMPVPLTGKLARGDKLTRAQDVAAAWNAGKVQVPPNAPWLDDFLAVVLAFTGVRDACDDDVDALAAMYDLLIGNGGRVDPNPIKPVVTGLAAEAM